MLFFLQTQLLFASHESITSTHTVNIGVLAHRGIKNTKTMWMPTVDYLSIKIPNYTFNLLPLTNDDILKFVANKEVDFIITNPASFAILEATYGVSRLATLRNGVFGKFYTVYGAVIFTHANRTDINSLQDLKGKSFTGVHANAFGGWWMAWDEMLSNGVDPESSFSELQFVGFPQDQIVLNVLKGLSDAGTVRTNLLERMAKEGKIDLKDIKVLAAKNSITYPFLHSTKLFPEWPFATSNHVPYDLALQVALALLSMPENNKAKKLTNMKAWTVPLDYSSVHEVMKKLQVGLYKNQGKLNPYMVLEKYWPWIVTILVILILLAMLSTYIFGLNIRLRDSNNRLELEIVDRKKLESILKYQAFYDSLTRLPNRALFLDRLQQAIFSGKRKCINFAIAEIDLNEFKEINDRYGHNAGDKLLKQVAERFKGVLRKTDTIARLGGDEFMILFQSMESSETAFKMAQKCLATLQDPINLDETKCVISASIGIAQFPKDGDQADVLIRHADLAMYKSKQLGRGISLFEPELDKHIQSRLELQSDLRKALYNGCEFQVVYQPKIEMVSNQLIGYEALMRWNHPLKGVLYPSEFIPIAEQMGLLNPIFKLMFEKVIKLIEISDRHHHKLNISINTNPATLTSKDFIETLTHLLNSSNTTNSLLEIEITNNNLMVNPHDIIRASHKLANLGVKLSIDNFGVNNISLQQVTKLPISGLKIDRSIVHNVHEYKRNFELVRSTIELGHKLGLWITAVGVENQFTKKVLLDLGCDFAQGNYFSKPTVEHKLRDDIRIAI